MHAKSLFRDSPGYELDQTNTVTALEAIQDFLNTLPHQPVPRRDGCHVAGIAEEAGKQGVPERQAILRPALQPGGRHGIRQFQQQYPALGLWRAGRLICRLVAAGMPGPRKASKPSSANGFLDAVAFYQQFIDAYPQSKNTCSGPVHVRRQPRRTGTLEMCPMPRRRSCYP
ncbi:MAG: hypothetical protein WKG07_36270 [Hymenobacter sp.]